MGMFGGGTKIIVDTQVTRVMQDKETPDSRKSGLIKAVIEDGDVGSYVLDEYVNSIAVKASRMYEYAKKGYTFGVPSAGYVVRAQAKEAIRIHLTGIEGKNPVFEYASFGPVNLTHMAWQKLVNDYAYDPQTNIIGMFSPTGKKAYLVNITMVIPQDLKDDYKPIQLEQLGKAPYAHYKPWTLTSYAVPASVPHSPVMEDPNIAKAYVKVTYGYETKVDGKIVVEEYVVNLDVTEDDGEKKDYYIASYTIDGIRKYWAYEEGSGNTFLDTYMDDGYKENGTYFPMTHFVANGHNYAQDQGAHAARTAQRQLNKLGLNFRDIAEQINTSPARDAFEQVQMVFAINPNTTNEYDKMYLFEYFNDMFLRNTEGITTGSNELGVFTPSGTGGVVIQDKAFKMTLSTGQISKAVITGNIGPVGKYSGGTGNSVSTTNRQTTFGSIFKHSYNTTYYFFRKQIGVDVYEEVRVDGLTMTYWIQGGNTTSGTNGSSLVLVPVDKSITDRFRTPDREQILCRSLHFLFTTLQRVETLGWFEQIFSYVLIVIAIVITIYTQGAGFKALGVALAAGGVVALQTIFVMVLKYIAVQVAVKLFVKTVGAEFAFFVAVIAVAYGLSNMSSAAPGAATGATVAPATGVATAGSASWANNLVTVGNSLMSEVGKYYQSAIEQIVEDFSNLQAGFEDQMEELEKLSEALLGTNNFLSPMIFFGETPSNYYTRTVHSGNIGLQTIESVNRFVEYALKLPDLNQSIQQSQA